MTFGKQINRGLLNIFTGIARKCLRCDPRQQPRERSKKFARLREAAFSFRSHFGKGRERRLAYSILKGGSFVFNIPSRPILWGLVWCGLFMHGALPPSHACAPGLSIAKPISLEEEALGVSRVIENLGQSTLRERAFHETYYSGMLTAPSHKEGTLIFHRPARLEKHVKVPVEESFIADGDSLLYKNPSREISQTFSLQDYPALAALIEGLRSLFNGDEETLRQVFHVSMAGTPNNWHLSLSPKTQNEEDGVDCLHLTGDSTHLYTISIYETNGDHSDLQLDPQVP